MKQTGTPPILRGTGFPLFGFGEAAWSPLMLGSKLRGWYDVSDAAARSVVSGAVASLSDKSGVGSSLVQSTAVNRPTFNSSGQNGLATMSLSALQSIATGVARADAAASVGYDWFIACDPQGATSGGSDPASFLLKQQTTVSNGGAGPAVFKRSVLALTRHNNTGNDFLNQMAAPALPANKFTIAGMTWELGGARRVRLNGALAASDTFAFVGAATEQNLQIDPNQTTANNGYEIGEIVLAKDLIAQEISDLETYLIGKWGFDP